MLQLEMSASDQRIQALRDQLQSEDDDLQREIEDRRRPRRANDVNPNLVPLLRGEAAPDLLVSDELDPPYGLEHTTPMFGIAINLIFAMSLLGGLVAWAILR
jgi:hypothetical protein